ncbi:VOC family protein [Winogradskyella aurantia]|uniref:PhnB-like domain-containing protein n=1 Tax=Winogradskyella aurantia TaxID=1915063 RepID=A0A265US90_9FLAO|nr:VOC family protein [Winogradskyella aurantia]OZV68161.1 hypothetical protein CA834_10975 [Winogradskyella aurantia]
MTKITPLLILALLTFGCSESKPKSNSEEVIALRTELDGLKHLKAKTSKDTESQIATFLTFQENNAEEAMNFYVDLFENSKITDIQRYGKDGPAKEGTIMVAFFDLNGSKFACSDSYMKHDWTFTPGVSIWVECKTADEIDKLFTKLSEHGKVLMPLDNYGFSTKFGFIEDRFGVSWQLNFEKT